MTHAVPLASTVSESNAHTLFGDVVPWLLMLLGMVAVGGAVLYMVRRWLRDSRAAARDGFTLHDLRAMRAAGELTQEEFERARALMIGRLSAVASPGERHIVTPAPPAPPPTGHDLHADPKHP